MSRLVIQAVSVVAAALVAATSILADPFARPPAEVRVAGTQLTVQPPVDFSQAVVRVVGPGGYEAQRVFDGASAMVLDLVLDGWLTVVDQRDANASRPEDVLEESRVSPAVLPDGRYRYEAVFTLADRVVGSVRGSFLVKAGATLDLHTAGAVEPERADAGSSTPTASEAGGDISSEGDFISDFVTITDVPNDGSTRLSLASETTGDTVLEWWDVQTKSGDFWICESGDDPGGCTTPRLAITDDSANTSAQVGIGTSAPARMLHLVTSATPTIRLEDTSPAGGFGDLTWTNGSFRLSGGGTAVVVVETSAPGSSLHVRSSGRVGVGTFNPQAKLHVLGDARVEGDIAIASSRSLKTGFGSVRSREILAAVADLPVASWRYQDEDATKRHIGPFAEDFQRLFGLGDGETISVIDAQGVALAAIQGLKEALDARDAEIATLRQAHSERLTALRNELEALKVEVAPR